jgi:hypothetical protein
VARLGQPPSPLVHPLARSIIALPPDKLAIAQGGGCRPTTVEWTSLPDRSEGSPATVWSWLKWEETLLCVSLGRGGQSSNSRQEP